MEVTCMAYSKNKLLTVECLHPRIALQRDTSRIHLSNISARVRGERASDKDKIKNLSADEKRFDQFGRALFSDGRVQLSETNNDYEQGGSLRVLFCAALDSFVRCDRLLEQEQMTVLEKREKFWKLWHCGDNVHMKPMYPCVEKLCENWDKNIVELKFGTDVNKFCKSVNMC
ncbi:hypothetical protein GCK32_009511 [Trichostrongylus colubriformis]|uniref:Uncharacterized protein n=1 Tax=Trichostrongylus colubriformis TaxID=6319 RepID=A0AAN8IJ99_TRICO